MRYLFILVAFFAISCHPGKPEHKQTVKDFIKRTMPECKEPKTKSVYYNMNGNSGGYSTHIFTCDKVQYTLVCRSQSGCVQGLYCEVIHKIEVE